MEVTGIAPRLIKRNVTSLVFETLADTPVTVIQGARQVGKSTLAKMVVARRGGHMVSLDEAGALASAREDPDGFVLSPPGELLVIDEAQRAPELVRALKAAVDADRRPGRFLVTGSADLLHVAGVSDSLAGRAQTVALQGLSQGEMQGHEEDFVSRVVEGGAAWIADRSSAMDRGDYVAMVCAGGYPEVSGKDGRSRQRWFDNYLQRIVIRDAAELSRLQHMERLGRLLRLIAANNAGELVGAHLARDAGIPETSLSSYLATLEHLYLVQRLPAWGHNLTKRVVSRPKIAVSDPGLAAHLTGRTEQALASVTGPNHFGGLLEGFVGSELSKQRTWSRTRYTLHHFRDRDAAEVDIVVETASGGVIGIEVKAARTVMRQDFRGLRFLQERSGAAFLFGLVLHAGSQALPFGEGLWSLPIEALWQG